MVNPGNPYVVATLDLVVVIGWLPVAVLVSSATGAWLVDSPVQRCEPGGHAGLGSARVGGWPGHPQPLSGTAMALA